MNKTIYFIPLISCILILVLCGYMVEISPPKDPNLKRVEQGLMSIVHYEGHSYVVWSINFGGGMIHDPDCLCHKGEK